MKFTNICTKLMPVSCIGKMKSLRMLLSIAYYRKLLLNKCKKCGIETQIHRPISLKGLEHVSIGDYFKLDVNSILEAWSEHNSHSYTPQIIIGNYVSLGKNCHVGCINRIEIGDNVLAGSNVLIIDHNHGNTNLEDLMKTPNERDLVSSGPIVIERNVWIGEKVCILPGVRIGRNSVIGAGSVVTKDIPPFSIAIGSPARVIKQYDEG